MTMKYKTLLAACALVLAASGLSLAQTTDAKSRYDRLDPETQEALMSEWEAKTPEEQDAIKQHQQERRDKWNSMTPDQQQQLKQRRKAAQDKYNSMTDEQKAEARKKWQEKRANQTEE